MGRDEAKLPDISRSPGLPAVPRPLVLRGPQPIDAEYRVVWAPWRLLREYWWALGYLAYCVVLWALAALVGWVL